MKSINDARYTMWATVYPRLDYNSSQAGQLQPAGKGHFERHQDPDSLQVVSVWVPDSADAPGTADAQIDIPCYARGYTDLGYRSSANREVFVQGEYNVLESVQFDYPKNIVLTHQSIITNIRFHQYDTDWVWVNEDGAQPIVWECQGTTPVHDPFGKLLRFTAVLKRAEIQ